MRQMAILVALLFLLACPLTLASDAARMTHPSGMSSPLTIRYPELAQGPRARSHRRGPAGHL